MPPRATAVEVRDTLGHAKLSSTDRYVSARYSEDFFERMDEAYTPKQPKKADPRLFRRVGERPSPLEARLGPCVAHLD
ncbi:MAG: hypothetical protein JWO02_2355 [Solirubrobacterales bacterium]|nr:hypothetical protein [Solirubrobacterales bacterium]